MSSAHGGGTTSARNSRRRRSRPGAWPVFRNRFGWGSLAVGFVFDQPNGPISAVLRQPDSRILRSSCSPVTVGRRSPSAVAGLPAGGTDKESSFPAVRRVCGLIDSSTTKCAPPRTHFFEHWSQSEHDRTALTPEATSWPSRPRPSLAGARAGVSRAVHGNPRRGDRHLGAAVDQDFAGLLRDRAAMGAERVHIDLRRIAAARWPGRRSARATACADHRVGRVHWRVARVRAGFFVGHADRCPRGRGRRRGARRPRDPGDRLDHVPRRRGAQQGDGDLLCDGRPRAGGRRPRRRVTYQWSRVGVDLLHQPAGGTAGAVPRPAAVARKPRAARSSSLRCRRCAARHRGAVATGLRAGNK